MRSNFAHFSTALRSSKITTTKKQKLKIINLSFFDFFSSNFFFSYEAAIFFLWKCVYISVCVFLRTIAEWRTDHDVGCSNVLCIIHYQKNFFITQLFYLRILKFNHLFADNCTVKFFSHNYLIFARFFSTIF